MLHCALRSFILAAIALVLATVASCDREAVQAGRPAANPGTQPASAPAIALDEQQLDYAQRPITYFNDKCGRCHGNYGTYWLEGVIAGLAEPKLREEVETMAAGPSQTPLEGLALEVQIAYHRSLADGKPFITVFGDEAGLSGEVTPGSRVMLLVDGREQAASVEAHRWTSSLRDASAVRATFEGSMTELPLAELKGSSSVRHSHGPAAK